MATKIPFSGEINSVYGSNAKNKSFVNFLASEELADKEAILGHLPFLTDISAEKVSELRQDIDNSSKKITVSDFRAAGILSNLQKSLMNSSDSVLTKLFNDHFEIDKHVPVMQVRQAMKVTHASSMAMS